MPTTILDEEFVEIKSAAKLDAKGRVAVGANKVQAGQPAPQSGIYQVSRNTHGQILLTPIVQMPAHEVWLWENPAALASVRQGLADARAGRLHPAGSFAEFADVDID